LGIQRFRFYIKCTDCARPITFLTDPKNADYEMESGGTRNYEVWHDESKVNAENEKSVEEEEKLDSMKALENRVAESQREMAEMDALEEIRAMNERHSRLMKGGGRKVDVAEAVLKAREVAMGGGDNMTEEELLNLNENGLTKDEEDLVQSIKFGKVAGDYTSASENAVEIHRLDEQDELLAEKRRQEEAEAIMNKQKHDDEGKKGSNNRTVPVFKVKRKKKKISSDVTTISNSTIPETKRAKVQEEEEVEKKAEVNPPSQRTHRFEWLTRWLWLRF